MKNKKEKEFQNERGMDFYLEEVVRSIKEEFKFSDSKIAKALREKAKELNPRKRTIKVDMYKVLDSYIKKHKIVLEEK